MARKQRSDIAGMVPMVRMMMLYLCILASFGTIILVVQASIEQKRIRYRIGELTSQKVELLEELRELDNRILWLERHEHVANVVSEKMPELGPPQHPAIELQVAGLTSYGNRPVSPNIQIQHTGILAELRRNWNALQTQMRGWLQRLGPQPEGTP